MKFLVLLILILLNCSWASTSFNLGVSLFGKSNFRKNDTSTTIFDLKRRGDVTFMVLPVLNFRAGGLRFTGRSLGYSFGSRLVAFTILGEYGGDRYNADGMVRRKSTFFAGASLRLLFFRFRVRQDILAHRSSGRIFTISAGKSFILFPKVIARMGLGIEYYNQKYVDYYFGVSDGESMSSYQGSSSINHYGSIVLTYLVAKGWNISWFTLYRSYGDAIRNSPTVKSHQELVASLSTSFSF